MSPRDIKPIVCGFPGLPKWLDRPLVKRTAEKYGITEEAAREHLRMNTLRELEPCKRREHGQANNECGTDNCIPIDRESLQKEPKDAPEISQEDGW